jgi:hypothetical protein
MQGTMWRRSFLQGIKTVSRGTGESFRAVTGMAGYQLATGGRIEPLQKLVNCGRSVHVCKASRFDDRPLWPAWYTLELIRNSK